MTILGAVLAGGASSRFGSDKALATIDGRTLLARAEAALAGVTDAVIVVGRGAVADLPAPGLGPLGGIAGALDHATRYGFDSVLTIGCDMPDLPVALLAALVADLPAYCPDAPILGHWPAALASALIGRIAPHARSRLAAAIGHGKNGALSVRRWAVEIGASAVSAPFPLRNVNTPADLPAS